MKAEFNIYSKRLWHLILLSVAGAILFAMHWWSIVIDVLGGDNDNDDWWPL